MSGFVRCSTVTGESVEPGDGAPAFGPMSHTASAPGTITKLEQLRIEINAALDDYLEFDPDCPEVLREAVRYSMSAGGKRLRPILVLLACDAGGGSRDAAMPVACAIELIHTYSLIHDDLPAMDDDDLRRGRPTNHVVYGEATAILAGDALLTKAFEIVASDIRPSETAAACCVDLAAAAGACGMVGGQVADLAVSGATGKMPGAVCVQNAQPATAQSIPEADQLEALEAIHRKKTGRLITAALITGARVAGADGTMVAMLEHYGACIGLAFQIADDLLDVSGDTEKTGKTINKDLVQGKLTYPAVLGVSESRDRAERLVNEACQTIAPLGAAGRELGDLARFIVERDH